MPIISVIAGISNLFCIILLANKKISNFIFGAIAVILFAIVAVITKQ
jgi:nicotinamide riboside transporter PnuC